MFVTTWAAPDGPELREEMSSLLSWKRFTSLASFTSNYSFRTHIKIKSGQNSKIDHEVICYLGAAKVGNKRAASQK